MRTLVLLAGEALIVWSSFVLGTRMQNAGLVAAAQRRRRIPQDSRGHCDCSCCFRIGLISTIPQVCGAKWDQTFRLLLVLGFVALALSAVGYLFPRFLPGNGSLLAGLVILTFLLFGWRAAYSWMVQQPYLRERVYVLGTGERAQRLVNGLRERSELGVEVVGWTGRLEGELTRDTVASHLVEHAQEDGVHRVIVAMPDRRGTLPGRRVAGTRLDGVKIEEATSWLEKMSGRIEVEQLYPSWLIFAEGFRFSNFLRADAAGCLILDWLWLELVISLPLLPLICWRSSWILPARCFTGRSAWDVAASIFYCYKFRTMRQDAEADTGATWATDDDPRITRVGRFLRTTRLDEIPQLWCVLKGDMDFVDRGRSGRNLWSG